MNSHTVRCMWPILPGTGHDLSVLISEAEQELAWVLNQAGAVVTGPGRWSTARSDQVPGSGRVTPLVLLFEAPARPKTRRTYHLPPPERETA